MQNLFTLRPLIMLKFRDHLILRRERHSTGNTSHGFELSCKHPTSGDELLEFQIC
jgi:hypothetical protein